MCFFDLIMRYGGVERSRERVFTRGLRCKREREWAMEYSRQELSSLGINTVRISSVIAV